MLRTDILPLFIFTLITAVKSSYYDDVMMQDLYKRLNNKFEADDLGSYGQNPFYNSHMALEDYPSYLNDKNADDEISFDKENDLNEEDEIRNSKLSNMDENDMDSIDPDIRGDSEYIRHGPSKWGFQYISGGAGEGEQALTPEGKQHNVQEVKSDESLPFYCHPPNPCPKGYTSEDGCDEGVQDTAEAQKKYIGNLMKTGQCTCDKEHMFQCPSDDDASLHNIENSSNEDELAEIISALSPNNDYPNENQYVVAKKAPESDSYEELVDPAKISRGNYAGNDLKLKRVAKKGFNRSM